MDAKHKELAVIMVSHAIIDWRNSLQHRHMNDQSSWLSEFYRSSKEQCLQTKYNQAMEIHISQRPPTFVANRQT